MGKRMNNSRNGVQKINGRMQNYGITGDDIKQRKVRKDPYTKMRERLMRETMPCEMKTLINNPQNITYTLAQTAERLRPESEKIICGSLKPQKIEYTETTNLVPIYERTRKERPNSIPLEEALLDFAEIPLHRRWQQVLKALENSEGIPFFASIRHMQKFPAAYPFFVGPKDMPAERIDLEIERDESPYSIRALTLKEVVKQNTLYDKILESKGMLITANTVKKGPETEIHLEFATPYATSTLEAKVNLKNNSYIIRRKD
ncbi:hypothetical protein D6825_00695 [Candidatus Woesearchaeota archaeon]|nr:MAG: hypothetical protein D6825_00695 [Candidatus Woesearchaeota archaeon]